MVTRYATTVTAETRLTMRASGSVFLSVVSVSITARLMSEDARKSGKEEKHNALQAPDQTDVDIPCGE